MGYEGFREGTQVEEDEVGSVGWSRRLVVGVDGAIVRCGGGEGKGGPVGGRRVEGCIKRRKGEGFKRGGGEQVWWMRG